MRNFLRFIRESFTGPSQRTNLLILFNVLIFIVIISRLFNLQILNGEYYEDNYVQKSIKYVTIPASRGNIYDKDGKILAYNELVYNLTIADVDAYKQNNKDINRRNRMLLQLSNILDKYGVNPPIFIFVANAKSGFSKSSRVCIIHDSSW